jgi:cell division protein FtsI/penicillin-binding protein 2
LVLFVAIVRNPSSDFDWRQLGPLPAVVPRVSPRRRLRRLMLGCWLCLFAVVVRGVYLEMAHGPAYRAEVRKLLEREHALPAARGQIVSHDGTVLAVDNELAALALNYRYLQARPDAAWLANQARQRLPKSQRRDRTALAQASDQLRLEIAELNAQLAAACGVSLAEWLDRCARVEQRVERIALSVNRRRWQSFAQRTAAAGDDLASHHSAIPAWWNLVATVPDALSALSQPGELAWQPVVVQEQTEYHIVVEDLSPEAKAQIAQRFADQPAVRLLQVPRRTYPHDTLAANLLGFVGTETEGPLSQVVGRQGVEHAHDATLAGSPGMAAEKTTRWGQVQEYRLVRSPQSGGDVRLTIDAVWQRSAEMLLDHTLSRLPQARGGAVVVIELGSLKPRVLATAPRFDPNRFAQSDGDTIEQFLTSSDKPLFDRARHMQLAATGCLQAMGQLLPTAGEDLFAPLVTDDAATLTPCQLAQVMAALATDGGYADIDWVDPMNTALDGPSDVSESIFNRQRLAASHKQLARLRAALAQHLQTATNAQHPLADVQPAVAAIDGELPSFGGPPHSWCAGLVPRDRPQFAFVVVIECGGLQRHLAASVVRKWVSHLLQNSPARFGLKPPVRP